MNTTNTTNTTNSEFKEDLKSLKPIQVIYSVMVNDFADRNWMDWKDVYKSDDREEFLVNCEKCICARNMLLHPIRDSLDEIIRDRLENEAIEDLYAYIREVNNEENLEF